MDKETYYKKRQQSRREVLNLWKEFGSCRAVLDMGCGAGSFGKYKPEGKTVYGIDIDGNAVRIAGKYEIAKRHDLEKRLPFRDSFFDGVLAKDVFEHMLKPWELLNEIRRVLKKGGIVVATVPAPGRKFWNDYTHVKPFTKKSVTEMFMDCGFDMIYVKRTRGIPGFGILGLNVFVPYILKIPPLGIFCDGYMIKAVKRG